MQGARRTLVMLLVCMAIARTGAAQTCVPAPAGLVGWWPGNGSVQDVVAGNDGQLGGGAGFTSGRVGQAFALDGSSDYVEIPDSPALRPVHVSVEAWVRFDSLETSQFGVPGLQYIVFKKNTRIFNFEAYALRKQRVGGLDRLVFSIGDVTGIGTLAVAQSSTIVTVGQVYHVVGT